MSVIRENESLNGTAIRSYRANSFFQAGKTEMRRGSSAFSGVEWKTTLFQLSSDEALLSNEFVVFVFLSYSGTARAWETRMQTRDTNTIHFVFEVYRLEPLFQKIGPVIRQFRLSCLQRPLKRPVVTSPCCIVASKPFDPAKKSYKPAFDIDVHVDTLRRGWTIAQFGDPEINRQTRKVIHHKLQVSL